MKKFGKRSDSRPFMRATKNSTSRIYDRGTQRTDKGPCRVRDRG